MRLLFHFATDHLAFAGPARPVLAAIRQADSLAQRGEQHRFVGFYLKLPAALPERYVKSHRSCQLGETELQISETGVEAVKPMPTTGRGYNRRHDCYPKTT